MNLWVNRVGQLAMLAVALFFLSCEDEASLLGFKNPTSQFELSYVDLDVYSRQLLDNGIRTSNMYYAGESNVFLVGKYVDPVFGTVSSGAYTQFLNTANIKIDTSAVFDSVSLKLTLTEYLYSEFVNNEYSDTKQKVNVYVLKDSLDERRRKSYNAVTPVQYDMDSLLGSKEFVVGTKTFVKHDTITTITVPLDAEWGRKIFASAERYRDATRGAKDITKWRDSAFVQYPNEFQKQFKGIAIVPDASCDKVMGINANTTRLELHYHTLKLVNGSPAVDKNLVLRFAFNDAGYMVSYNKIDSDRSGKEIDGLLPNKPKILDKRYIQGGVGLSVEVDFSDVLKFADTIPNILIQSATLSIEDVSDDDYGLPTVLTLRALNTEKVRTKFYSSAQDRLNAVAYNSFIFADYNQASLLVDYDSSIYMRNDIGSGALLNYDKDNNRYAGSVGGFLQQMVKEYNGRTPYMNFSIYPTGTTALKSVHRTVFDPAKLRLRIYYVKPTVNTN